MKTNQQRIVFLILASAIWSFFAASCSTIRGVGKDVESTGENIQRASTSAQHRR